MSEAASGFGFRSMTQRRQARLPLHEAPHSVAGHIQLSALLLSNRQVDNCPAEKFSHHHCPTGRYVPLYQRQARAHLEADEALEALHPGPRATATSKKPTRREGPAHRPQQKFLFNSWLPRGQRFPQRRDRPLHNPNALPLPTVILAGQLLTELTKMVPL